MNVLGLSNLANILVRITRATGKSPYNLKQARAAVRSIDPLPHIHRTRMTVPPRGGVSRRLRPSQAFTSDRASDIRPVDMSIDLNHVRSTMLSPG